MSLINQMLSDLEARRLDRSDDSDRALEGLHCARSELREDAEPNSANRFLAAAFIGIVTACLAWYGLNLIDRDALADQNTQSHSFDALQPITDLEPVPQERTENLAEQEATDPSETAATSAPIKTEDNVYPAEHLPPPVLDEALELAAVKRYSMKRSSSRQSNRSNPMKRLALMNRSNLCLTSLTFQHPQTSRWNMAAPCAWCLGKKTMTVQGA